MKPETDHLPDDLVKIDRLFRRAMAEPSNRARLERLLRPAAEASTSAAAEARDADKGTTG